MTALYAARLGSYEVLRFFNALRFRRYSASERMDPFSAFRVGHGTTHSESHHRSLSHALSTLLRNTFVIIALAAGLTVWALEERKPPMKKIGPHLAKMSDLYYDHRLMSIGRGVTAQQQASSSLASAKQLAAHCEALRELLPKLDTTTPFALELQGFLTKWPTADSFLQDLLRGTNLEGSMGDIEIASLRSQAPDKGSTWRTPFRMFRP